MFFGRFKTALDVASSFAVLVAATALVWTLLMRPTAAPAGPPSVERVTGLTIDAAKIRNVTGTGRVAIVEFSDFQCPFCAKYAKETLPTIKRDLISSGRVRYIALNYPLESIHPLALQAGEAAECAGSQGRYWDMHERLFENPKAVTRADLTDHAQAIGLDDGAFDRCIDEHDALEHVRADQAEGRRLGVKGTPTFFIGRMKSNGGIDLVARIPGNAPAEVLAREVASMSQEGHQEE